MISLVGQRVSQYRILEQLGEGGMGVVYKAEDTRLHRTVALKFLNPEMVQDERGMARLEHEAAAAAQLDHPNIATIYHYGERLDSGTSTRQAFIAMEFIDGEPLTRRIARGPVPFGEVARIARQLAEALCAAHEKGIVHRDVKPSNIILRSDGSVKVMDFGIAKLSGQTRLTMTGHVVGSIAYMSPEQVRNEDVDLRSDVWSYGVVLYELLTQRHPFHGEHMAAMVYSIGNEDPVPADALRKGIPPPLAEVCRRCLRKDAAERPQSMREVLALLEGMAQEPHAAKHRTRRIPSWWPAAVLVVLVILVLAVPNLRKSVEGILGAQRGDHRILALLPFSAIDTSQESREYCSALFPMLSSRLAQLTRGNPSIWLVSARDVATNGIVNSEDARKTLGASLVVSGNVQRMNNVVRLTIDLVDPAVPRQLDSFLGSYPADNYRVMEDDALAHILGMLDIDSRKAMASSREGSHVGDEAYQFYAQAAGYLQQYSRVQNIEYAIDLYRKAIQRDSLFAEAFAGLAEAYWRMFEGTNDTSWISLASAASSHALQLKPELPEAYVAVGIIQRATGHYEKAVADFKSALEYDPQNITAYRELASAYDNVGDIAMAESTYHRAIALNPSYWGGYSYLGAFYGRHARYAEAEAQFRKVTELTPDNVRGYNNLAAVSLQQEHWSDATDALEHAVRLKPTYVTYSLLGNVYFYQRRFLESASAYQHALSLDSSDYRIWANLAGAQYWTPGMRERSTASYRRAAGLAEVQRGVNPRDHDILSNLAVFYAYLGEKTRSMALLKQSLRGGENDPELLERAADAYLACGDREKSVQYLQRAIRAGYELKLVQNSPVYQELMADSHTRAMIERSALSPQ